MQEWLNEQIGVPEGIAADYAFRCKGDCMINARIFDGDIVYIHAQPSVDNDQIAAVTVDGQPLLKRFHKYDDRIVLTPENPKYRPLVFYGEEMNRVQMIGKAVAFSSVIR